MIGCPTYAFIVMLIILTSSAFNFSVTKGNGLNLAVCRTRSLSILSATSGISSSRQKLRKKKLQTFARYLEVECWKQAQLRELEPVLQAVANACKQINRIVQRAQTDDVYGVAVGADGNPLEETNVQGEVQQKLDVLCNTIMLRAFCGSSRHISSVASEEEDEPRCCSDVMVSRMLNTGSKGICIVPHELSSILERSGVLRR